MVESGTWNSVPIPIPTRLSLFWNDSKSIPCFWRLVEDFRHALFLKILNLQNLLIQKNFQKYSECLSATEKRLKHFHRSLTYFSIADCVGSLFWVTRYVKRIFKTYEFLCVATCMLHWCLAQRRTITFGPSYRVSHKSKHVQISNTKMFITINITTGCPKKVNRFGRA